MSDRKNQQKKIAKLIERWDAPVRAAIQQSRRDMGLSQEVVAERMGWTQDILSNVEAGRREISVTEFIVLSNQMGVDPAVMFRRVLKW